MTRTPPPNGHAGKLIEPPAAEQQEVMTRWRRQASGMGGRRITELQTQDDPIPVAGRHRKTGL